jgi:small subunit ribosomal protein S17
MVEQVSTGERGVRARRHGRVVSKSGDKSIVVVVERRLRHPLYRKVMRQKRNYHAHDEANEARPGDEVEIVECRPYSRMKHWRLTRVLARAAGAGGAA